MTLVYHITRDLSLLREDRVGEGVAVHLQAKPAVAQPGDGGLLSAPATADSGAGLGHGLEALEALGVDDAELGDPHRAVGAELAAAALGVLRHDPAGDEAFSRSLGLDPGLHRDPQLGPVVAVAVDDDDVVGCHGPTLPRSRLIFHCVSRAQVNAPAHSLALKPVLLGYQRKRLVGFPYCLKRNWLFPMALFTRSITSLAVGFWPVERSNSARGS